MLNLNRISPTADFYSKITALELKLDYIQKNILYITHMQDKILKTVNEIVTDKGLQKQVDEYFEEENDDSGNQQ